MYVACIIKSRDFIGQSLDDINDNNALIFSTQRLLFMKEISSSMLKSVRICKDKRVPKNSQRERERANLKPFRFVGINKFFAYIIMHIFIMLHFWVCMICGLRSAFHRVAINKNDTVISNECDFIAFM